MLLTPTIVAYETYKTLYTYGMPHDFPPRRLMLFSGSHDPGFAERVAAALKTPLSSAHIERFANSELKVRLGDSVRGADVFIFQAHNAPVNDAIMEQAIMIDAAKRSSAAHITAVCPFFGYARQDRKSRGREPITARLVMDIFSAAGADRIVTIDLHSGQIQGFFDGPFDHLIAGPAIEAYIKKTYTDFVMVSPDAGRVKQTERFANHLNAPLAIVHKHRSATNVAEAITIIGDVAGKHCIINDDMIDTAGTICAAADLLKKRGATRVSVVATHGLFYGPAFERIEASGIDSIAVTDTLPLPEDAPTNISVIPITDLVAEAIAAIHSHGSISEIFHGDNHS